jgi:hypothetical protein
MTYVEHSQLGTTIQLEPGRAHDYLDRIVRNLKSVGQFDYFDFDGENATSERAPAEQRLAEIQRAISAFSMHLPQQFATGLGRQFANMLDQEAWDEDDMLPDLSALSTFLNMLIRTCAQRRPGIGTNGRGSVTAFWSNGGNRLTADCLPTGKISWVLSATSEDGEKERAAGNCLPARLSAVVAPYNPGIWFDQ